MNGARSSVASPPHVDSWGDNCAFERYGRECHSDPKERSHVHFLFGFPFRILLCFGKGLHPLPPEHALVGGRFTPSSTSYSAEAYRYPRRDDRRRTSMTGGSRRIRLDSKKAVADQKPPE